MEDDVRRLLQKGRYDQALEWVLDRYQAKIFRMALAILRDPGRAEEVAQDVFVKVWQAFPTYDGRASVKTWVYTIARNTCLSALRAASYRIAAPLDDAAEPRAAGRSSHRIEIDQCLSRLPAVQRQVITLFYLEDRSVAEVASMLDLPEGTVKSHLHRARRALGEMMGNNHGLR
jgi:RNA polymerase sigma-70 factor (ECF subfamily)